MSEFRPDPISFMMSLGISLRLQILFLLFGALPVMAQTDPKSATRLLDHVMRISNPKLVCEPGTEPKKLFEGLKCSELTSNAAPLWVFNDPNGAFFRKPDRWHPVCSWYKVGNIRKEDPKINENQLVQELVNSTVADDFCSEDLVAKDESTPSEDSDEESPKPLNLEQRKAKLQEVESVRALAVHTCCGSDSECTRLMNAVPVGFCENFETDPKKPDTCLESPTAYIPDFGDSRRWYREANRPGALKEKIRSKAIGHFMMDPGRITVSPYEYENDQPTTYFHEFGHACSQIRRSLAVNAGSREEFYDFIDPNNCTMTEASTTTYSRLVSQRGFQAGTFECLRQKAADAKKPRFGKARCKDACERTYLDEAYADLFTATAIKKTGWVPDFIPENLCNALRDDTHMLASDILRCMLKTPQVEKDLHEALGCTQ